MHDTHRGSRPADLASERDRLLTVATATFAEYGWRDSTVDAVCHRADITSADFYTLYATVDDLFAEMYAREAAARVTAVRDAMRPVTDGLADEAPDATIARVASALAAATSDRDWWILTTEYMLRAVRHPDVATTYRALRRQTHRAMAEAIGEALEQAGLAGSVDVDQFVEIISSLHRGAVAQNFLEPDATSPQVLDHHAWTAVLRATAT